VQGVSSAMEPSLSKVVKNVCMGQNWVYICKITFFLNFFDAWV